ncbi:hypothetical protein H2203_001113 [Taxawa tesnikishii (nom. ined.)]|nr:hypothetical protein H2203_001113 [Dothideales sp. JES 119]
MHLPFYADLAGPLLSRAIKKRVHRDLRTKIIQMIIDYLQAHPSATHEDALWSGESSFVHHVVRLWSEYREDHEHLMPVVVSLIPEKRLADLHNVVDLLNAAWFRYRYDLLHVLILRGKGSETDIGKADDLHPSSSTQWLPELFTALPTESSLELLQRLATSRPAMDFLAVGQEHSIFQDKALPNMPHGNTVLLRTYLERGYKGALERAKSAINGRKARAAKSREQDDRAFFARSCLFLAIASGSLEVYAETLIWARRFNRDALTVKSLYTGQVFQTSEGIELLSGIPEHPLRDSTMQDIGTRVTKANSILTEMVETARMGQREPFFHWRDWQAVFGLFKAVVHTRLRRYPRLEKIFSNDACYDSIWKPTVEALISAEEFGLKEENEKLRFNSLNGVLAYHDPSSVHYDYEVVSEASAPTYCHFLNDLAIRRDQLWERRRPLSSPAVTSLPEPWPRGLAVQHLTHHRVKAEHLPPHVVKRAERVVFMESRLALAPMPEDKEAIDAIGPFVDDYRDALKTYVQQGVNRSDQVARTNKAWDHALNELTGDRMTRDESVCFWRNIFKLTDTAQLHIPVKDPYEKLPESFPIVDNADEPTEWNPASGRPLDLEERPLQSTILDCMLEAGWFHYTDRPVLPITQTTVATKSESFFNRDGVDRFMTPKTREALIASVLLFVDSQKGGGRRLLTKAFPGFKDVRFPSLFLDEEFLFREDVQRSQTLKILGKLLPHVPASLLATLTENALDVLTAMDPEAPALAKREEMCIQLLSLLEKSDRPELATDMVLRTVLDRPDASSWHRKLLAAGFFKRLGPSEVQDFLIAFGETAKSRLHPGESPSDGPAISSGPLIKVTTVKALAQLMQNAKFVSPTLSVRLLRELFQRATHIDIRVAIAESLLNMLADCIEEVWEQVMCALTEDVIPVATVVNERGAPMNGTEWARAGNVDPLPEIHEPLTLAQPPLLAVLMHTVRSEHPLRERRQEFIDRIVVPAIRRSMESNRNWLVAFLSEHEALRTAGVTVEDLPLVPLKPSLLSMLFENCIELLPATVDGISLLDCYGRFIMTNMSPTPATSTLTKYVLDTPNLRASNAGGYVLSLYNKGLEIFRYGYFEVAQLLQKPWKPTRPDGISVSQVQDFAMQIAEALIAGSDESFAAWDSYIEAFKPPIQGSQERQKAWVENSKPVVERMRDFIGNLRTREWRDDPHRRPAVLPYTFALELMLLPRPGEEAMRYNAMEVRRIMPAGLYHEKFAQLRTSILGSAPADRIDLACGLGQWTNAELSNLLAIDLADELLRKAAAPRQQEHAQMAVEMLEGWRNSPNEDVRMRGLRTTRFLRKKDGGKNWFMGASNGGQAKK